jgi:hypothetical protein
MALTRPNMIRTNVTEMRTYQDVGNFDPRMRAHRRLASV